MYSSQPAHLAANCSFRGLSMILAAIVILAIAALAVGVYATAVGAPKAQVGDHSQDIGEGTRAGIYAAQDGSLDQVENLRVQFSKAHHNVAPVTVVTTPVKPANDSWDTLRQEHLRAAPAAKAAQAEAARDNLIAFRRAQAEAAAKAAAPAAIATDDWSTLRMEHVRGIPPGKAMGTTSASDGLDAFRKATGSGR